MKTLQVKRECVCRCVRQLHTAADFTLKEIETKTKKQSRGVIMLEARSQSLIDHDHALPKVQLHGQV